MTRRSKATADIAIRQAHIARKMVTAGLVLVVPTFDLLGSPRLAGSDWVDLALLGVFCTGLSQFLFVKSLEGLEARIAGMIIALEPVCAIIGAWWLFGDQPSLRMAAGAALIVLATILADARKAPAEQGDTSRCAH